MNFRFPLTNRIWFNLRNWTNASRQIIRSRLFQAKITSSLYLQPAYPEYLIALFNIFWFLLKRTKKKREKCESPILNESDCIFHQLARFKLLNLIINNQSSRLAPKMVNNDSFIDLSNQNVQYYSVRSHVSNKNMTSRNTSYSLKIHQDSMSELVACWVEMIHPTYELKSSSKSKIT